MIAIAIRTPIERITIKKISRSSFSVVLVVANQETALAVVTIIAGVGVIMVLKVVAH